MAHTIVRVYMHIVFSTRKRQPLIVPDMEQQLHQYIGGICKNLECWPVQVGGFKDHVHILCSLDKNVSVVELVEEVKIASSRWLMNRNDYFRNFSWQVGYAGFSVGEDDLPKISHYIEMQKVHHTQMTFEQEFKKLLTENEVEFDEQFLFK